MFLLVYFSTDPFEDLPLDLSDQFDHQVITRLRKGANFSIVRKGGDLF